MLKGNNSMKLNNKSSKKVQVNNIVSVTSNSGTYVEIGVPTHNQYNSEVSMSKAQYLFDTTDNIALYSGTDETLVNTRFETIGDEPMICNCIKIQDIFNFYTSGCIQEFYNEFCKSHSTSESITLGRFLSAIGIEVWRDVDCYNGIYKDRYMVSNLGRVLSLYKNKHTKIIKPCDNGNGYLYVWLYYKGHKQAVRVNRLVSITFYGESNEKLDACHANTHKTDNRLFNLDFGTRSYNMKNPLTLKKLKESAIKAKADKAESATTTSATSATTLE